MINKTKSNNKQTLEALLSSFKKFSNLKTILINSNNTFFNEKILKGNTKILL